MESWHVYPLVAGLLGIFGLLAFLSWKGIIPARYAKWLLPVTGILFSVLALLLKGKKKKDLPKPKDPVLIGPPKEELDKTDKKVDEVIEDSRKINRDIEDTKEALDELEKKEEDLKRREAAVNVDGYDPDLSAFGGDGEGPNV